MTNILNKFTAFIKNLFPPIKPASQEDVTVYFVSGMCNNCRVFDLLTLPKGYVKQYIEWHIPREEETLDEYAHEMASSIDSSKPFVLIGYSLGGLIVQEMNNFITPQKTIVISSMTNEREIPALFRWARSIHFAERVPKRVLSATEFITDVFTKYIYEMPTERIAKYMVYTDPVYIKWAICQITNWMPKCRCRNLYHIHGTKDQIFPYEQLDDDVYTVKGGDHLMVMDRAQDVSAIVEGILLLSKNKN